MTFALWCHAFFLTDGTGLVALSEALRTLMPTSRHVLFPAFTMTNRFKDGKPNPTRNTTLEKMYARLVHALSNLQH